MQDALNVASVNGFVLGMLAADQLHTTPQACVADNEAALFDLILAIADGTKSFVPEKVSLLESLSSSANGAWTRKAMQETAMRLVEWYRRQCLS
jgi:hypothetical protein